MELHKIREKSNVPVILLTAKSEDTDKVLGLTIGAENTVRLSLIMLIYLKRQIFRMRQPGNIWRYWNVSHLNLRS